MDSAQTLGAQMRWLVPFAWVTILAAPLAAADRYAVVITGAAGGAAYAEKYDTWRTALLATLRQKFNYPDDRLVALSDLPGPNPALATRENVRRVFADLRSRLAADDLLTVILIGHGTTGEGDEAKFNLVGPDLTSSEWAALLKPLPGTLVFVNTTGGSFPFIRRLAAHGRVVVTATESAAQQFETIFPEFFVKALEDPAADQDKNGRVSIWEAFGHASDAVRQRYERDGQLATERAVLDDNGDGIGREAPAPGTDGALARVIYPGPDPPRAGDPELLKRRAALERQLEDLRTQKASSSNPTQFEAEIERLLIEIAKISRRPSSPP